MNNSGNDSVTRAISWFVPVITTVLGTVIGWFIKGFDDKRKERSTRRRILQKLFWELKNNYSNLEFWKKNDSFNGFESEQIYNFQNNSFKYFDMENVFIGWIDTYFQFVKEYPSHKTYTAKYKDLRACFMMVELIVLSALRNNYSFIKADKQLHVYILTLADKLLSHVDSIQNDNSELIHFDKELDELICDIEMKISDYEIAISLPANTKVFKVNGEKFIRM